MVYMVGWGGGLCMANTLKSQTGFVNKGYGGGEDLKGNAWQPHW
jgi:hypothetical protein